MTSLCLPQMDHLVVLHRCRYPVSRSTRIEAVSLLLRRRQDFAEERQSLVPLPQPEGIDYGRHVGCTAGSYGMPHDGHYLEHHQHFGRKGTNNHRINGQFSEKMLASSLYAHKIKESGNRDCLIPFYIDIVAFCYFTVR